MKSTSDSTPIDSQNNSQVSDLFQRIRQIDLTSSHYLMVVAGPNNSQKIPFLKKVIGFTGNFSEIDLRTLITVDEEETKRNIDTFFEALKKNGGNILFRNGDVLAGEYTGFTYSTVRYATPQEKYLLNKIKGSETFFILDLKEPENIDMTLKRFAQSVILFSAPTSLFGRLLWALKSVKLNGHTFINKRQNVQTA